MPTPERPSLSLPPLNPNASREDLYAPPLSPRRRRRGWLYGLYILAAVVLLGGGGYIWLVPLQARATEITATASRTKLVISVTERGELESAKTVDVRCEMEGHQNKIVEIVPEGTHVQKGQVVVKLDVDQLTTQHADQEIKLRQAEGAAKARKEDLAVAKNKAESDIAQAQLKLDLAVLDRDKYLEGDYKVELDDRKGAIALAEKDLQEAEEKLAHYRNFVRKGFGTPEQLRLKEAEVARVKFNLSRDQAKLLVLEKFQRRRQEAELNAKAEDAKRELERTKSSAAASIAKAEADLEAADVTVNLERKRLERIKAQMDKAVVKAPQDGIVVYSKDRYWDPASRIQAGGMVHFQQNIFTLPDLARMRVKVKIHESMVKRVKAGQKAEIRVDALPNHVLHGTIENVATLADSAGPWDERGVKEYATQVSIDDLPADAGLKPGMTAEVRILIGEIPNALVVPIQAVAEFSGKHFAYVVEGSSIEKREVVIGESNEKFMAIKEGLSEGQAVALNARSRLQAEAKDEHAPTGVGSSKSPAGPPPK